jgi:hypothetical protein
MPSTTLPSFYESIMGLDLRISQGRIRRAKARRGREYQQCERDESKDLCGDQVEENCKDSKTI